MEEDRCRLLMAAHQLREDVFPNVQEILEQRSPATPPRTSDERAGRSPKDGTTLAQEAETGKSPRGRCRAGPGGHNQNNYYYYTAHKNYYYYYCSLVT